MINILGSDEDLEPQAPALDRKAKAKSVAKKASSSTNNVTGTDESSPPQVRSKGKRQKGKKQNPAADAPVKPDANRWLSELAEVDGLPAFALAAWNKTFLPTLYNILYCSETPFKDFQKNQQVVAHVQKIVDLVYPGSGYRVKWGDALCQTVS